MKMPEKKRWPNWTFVIGSAVCIAACALGFLLLFAIEEPLVAELSMEDPSPSNPGAHYFPATIVSIARQGITVLLWLVGLILTIIGTIGFARGRGGSQLVCRWAWTAAITSLGLIALGQF
jgi:hypothetical protein